MRPFKNSLQVIFLTQIEFKISGFELEIYEILRKRNSVFSDDEKNRISNLKLGETNNKDNSNSSRCSC